MSECFLTGSSYSKEDIKKNPALVSNNGRCIDHPLEILISIEYLSFDLINNNIRITNDFFVHNKTDKPYPLLCMHKGAIEFIPYKGDWLRDKETTGMLFHLGAASELGFKLNRDSLTVMDKINEEEPIRFKLLQDSDNVKVDLVTNQIPDSNKRVPYTLIKSPLVQPNEYSIYRVIGTLENEAYQHLMKSYFEDNIIVVNGGKSLLDEIGNEVFSGKEYDFREKYESLFDQFVSQYYTISKKFFVFTEEQNPSIELKYCNVEDVLPGETNAKYKKRNISWYWAYTNFKLSLQGKEFNPVVELYHEGNIKVKQPLLESIHH